MSQEEGKFDGIFMQVIQQSQGIEGFFNEVFGFLRRKTDFFKDKKKAEEAIVKQCSVNYEKFTADQKELKQQEKEKKEREEKRKQEQEAKKKAEQKQESPKKVEEKVQEVKKPEPPKEEVKKEEKSEETKEEKKEGEEGEKKEDNEKPPVGNGGTTDRYVWTQTLEEVVMRIPVEEDVKGKTCQVKMTPTHLSITIKGKVFMDQDFIEKIKVEDSLWTLETDLQGTKYINLTLAKWGSDWHWWDSCLKGDPKINTQKISPEPSNLSDLDGETRGTVEKMMFDMRQKQMGKPSSDELKKQDMLSGFMKSHPEMDFSKCKFQ